MGEEEVRIYYGGFGEEEKSDVKGNVVNYLI